MFPGDRAKCDHLRDEFTLDEVATCGMDSGAYRFGVDG
jgi:hypothetical protein